MEDTQTASPPHQHEFLPETPGDGTAVLVVCAIVLVAVLMALVERFRRSRKRSDDELRGSSIAAVAAVATVAMLRCLLL